MAIIGKSLREEILKSQDRPLLGYLNDIDNKDSYKKGFNDGWASCVDYILNYILRDFTK
jgi:hypothetical protein